MRTQTRFLALAMVAALAIAGCGQDNNDNEGGGGTIPTSTPQRTATPVVIPTATTAVVPTVTSTGGGSETPVPTATSTPGDGGDCNGEGAHLHATLTSGQGSDLDTGWTGIGHNQVATYDSVVTTNLDCVGDECVVDGSALVNTKFGSPLPLSAGGVSVCVLNTFREPVTGTYNCVTGCASSTVKLISSIFQVQDASQPCPPCVGDPVPNDGLKQGTCRGGKAPNAPCDVGGISALFQDSVGAPVDAGMTSNDCQPDADSVGELEIDLNPLTTGDTTITANVDCLSDAYPPGSCYCPGQVQPNFCVPDGVCTNGFCLNNKPIGTCSGQPYRSCKPADGAKSCGDRFPGAGTCEAKQQACFGTSITRTGVCGTSQGTLAAVFCVGETDAPAVNTASGLPGPAAVLIPGTVVRTPR